ncbi:hypothetical protein H4R35_005027 [Dimargaris xerosporica]|nr:hypothetical protein H4R35_005027 [Dimargaris xerosporica]
MSNTVRCVDVNTLERIAQWSVDHTEMCLAAFSFDENEIHCVNQRGQKPGMSISTFDSAPQVEGANDHFLTPQLVTASHDTEHIAACLVPLQASIMVNILLTASEDGLIRVHQLVKVMS